MTVITVISVITLITNIGGRIVAWNSEDIEAWLTEKIEQTRNPKMIP